MKGTKLRLQYLRLQHESLIKRSQRIPQPLKLTKGWDQVNILLFKKIF